MQSRLDKIEKSRLTQLETIRNNTQAQLDLLTLKYSLTNKAKTSFALVAYVLLSALYGAIFLNDLAKLMTLVLEKLAEKKMRYQIANEATVKQLKRDMEKRKASIEREGNEMYNSELNEYLRRIHMRLLVACSKKTRKTSDESPV